MRISILIREATLQQLIEAKASWLKAIDFTIGLLRRLQKLGKKFPVDYNVAIKRLIEMRKITQDKFRMDTLGKNLELLEKGKGRQVVNQAEKIEKKYTPTARDYAAFQQALPNKAGAAKEAQAKRLIAALAPVLNVDPAEVEDLVIDDKAAFEKAYATILPELKKLKSDVDAMMPKSLGIDYGSRVKDPNSLFLKQTREGARVPFTRFSDLVGCRIVTANLRDMCAAAYITQKKFDIVNKKNYYVKTMQYNAINYNFVRNGIVVEFQLKTKMNDVEARITHDLIHAKEKAIVDLSDREKDLVGKIIDASTQLSMREWQELLGTDFVTSKSYDL